MKICFVDCETQKTFFEAGLGNYDFENAYKLGIALLGVRYKSHNHFSDDRHSFLPMLNYFDLIVGYNLDFDFGLLKTKKFVKKSFDMAKFLRHVIGKWVSLDEICKTNLGIKKERPKGYLFTNKCSSLLVSKMYREGNMEGIKKYLARDLFLTEKLYFHLMNVKSIKHAYTTYDWDDKVIEDFIKDGQQNV